MNVKLLVASMMLATVGIAVGQSAPSATAVTCTAVEDRAPVGEASSFPASVGQVYCFSELHDVDGPIVHVWFHGDREVRRIELPVRASRWRTWSAKSIPASWTGAWRVEVQSSAGDVLASASFVIE